MNLKNIHIKLDTSDIQQIMSIALDDDKDQALTFIKKNLVKQLEKALQPH
ncbi:hypothetical protein ACFL03_01855 [Thermodesulfobacteriota bacterium]